MTLRITISGRDRAELRAMLNGVAETNDMDTHNEGGYDDGEISFDWKIED